MTGIDYQTINEQPLAASIDGTFNFWVMTQAGVSYSVRGSTVATMVGTELTAITQATNVASGVAAAAGGARMMSLGASQPLGVYAGSGVPTISAGKGSLYLRTDGSGVNDRAYINTDGGTGWAALTTAS